MVELQAYASFDDVCVLAHKVEQQKKAKHPQKPPNTKPFIRNQPFNKGSSNPPPKPQIPFPSNPQRISAPQKAPATPFRPNPNPMSNRRCFKCQGLGHIGSECPNKIVVTLAEWIAVKEDFEEEENEVESELETEETQDEVIEEADEGVPLVLRGVLGNQKGPTDEQRENTFHTRCTTQGKICSLIINGGSCANVVSLSMIEKLGLQTITHPHPYNMMYVRVE